MSKVNPGEVRYYHGKMSKNDPGYFYVTQKGEQYFRKREEKYQRNQSPRQKWNSLAFGYAHKKIRQLWSSDELIEQVNQEWQNAHKIGPNNRPYPDAKGWKFAMYKPTGKQNIPSKPGTNNTSQKYPRKPQRKLLPRILPTICSVIRRKSSKHKPLSSAPNSQLATNNNV